VKETKVSAPDPVSHRNFKASVASIEATRFTAEFKIPAGSQVSTCQPAASAKRQVRRRSPQNHVERCAVASNGCGMIQGRQTSQRSVYQVTVSKCPCRPKSDRLAKKLFHVGRCEIRDFGLDHNLGIKGRDSPCGGNSLAEIRADIGFFEQSLRCRLLAT